MRLPLLALVLLAPLAGALSACEGNSLFGEARLRADTVTIAAPTSGTDLPTAIDLVRQRGVEPIESFPEFPGDANRWDFVVRQQGGQLVLRPFEPIEGGQGAGSARATRDFDQITEAPRGTGEYSDQPAALALNATYYLRSRPWSTGYQRCVTYAKAKVTALNPAAQTVSLALVINENCDDERLST